MIELYGRKGTYGYHKNKRNIVYLRFKVNCLNCNGLSNTINTRKYNEQPMNRTFYKMVLNEVNLEWTNFCNYLMIQ